MRSVSGLEPGSEVTPTPEGRSDIADRVGWALVAAIVALVALTWAPALGLSLGDSHEGRILARQGLQAANFWELGPVDSHLGADWSPYSSVPYANHPPLTNGFQVSVVGLAGSGEVQVRIFSYLSGLATILGLAAVLRIAGVRWIPTLLAIGVTVATPFFWVFGRIGIGLALILFLAALIMRLRPHDDPTPLLVWGTGAVAFFTVLGSWEGMLASALFGIWLWRRRGADRPAVIVGVAMLVGAALTAMWILAASDTGSLLAHIDERTSFDFALLEFVARQIVFAIRLLPVWFLVLAPFALWYGIKDRRTRPIVLITLVVAVAFAIGLPDNAFRHEYWNYPVLAPIALGAAVMFEHLAERLSRVASVSAAVLIVAVVTAALASLTFGSIHQERFADASDSGALLEEYPPAPGQERAWMTEGLAAPRWLSYYWDLPPRLITLEAIAEVPEGDLVLVKLSERPSWVPEAVIENSEAVRGDYAIVRALYLRQSPGI